MSPRRVLLVLRRWVIWIKMWLVRRCLGIRWRLSKMRELGRFRICLNRRRKIRSIITSQKTIPAPRFFKRKIHSPPLKTSSNNNPGRWKTKDSLSHPISRRPRFPENWINNSKTPTTMNQSDNCPKSSRRALTSHFCLFRRNSRVLGRSILR